MKTTATMNNTWKVRKEAKQTTSQTLAMRRQPPLADSDVISPVNTSFHSSVAWIVGIPGCCFMIFRICELPGVCSWTTLLPLSLLSWLSLITPVLVFLPHLAIAIKQAGIGRSPAVWYMFRITICITTENAQTHTSTVIYVPAMWMPWNVFARKSACLKIAKTLIKQLQQIAHKIILNAWFEKYKSNVYMCVSYRAKDLLQMWVGCVLIAKVEIWKMLVKWLWHKTSSPLSPPVW